MIRVCQHKPVKGMDTVQIAQECWGTVGFLADSYSLRILPVRVAEGQDCGNERQMITCKHKVLLVETEGRGRKVVTRCQKVWWGKELISALRWCCWSRDLPLPTLFWSVDYSLNTVQRQESFLPGKFPYSNLKGMGRYWSHVKQNTTLG